MPNPNNESRAWLYDKLKGKGYNVGKDYNEFDSLMTNNADSRRWVYDTATKDGLNVGKDYGEFESLINPTTSQTEQNAQAGQQTAESQVASAQEQSTPETAYNPYHVDIQDFKPNVQFGQQQTQQRQDFTPATSPSDVYKTDTTNAIAEGSERARSRTSYEMNRDAMLNLPEEEKQKEIEKAAAGKMLDIIEDKQNPINDEVRKIFPDYHYVTERTERFDTFLADYRAKDYNLGEIDRKLAEINKQIADINRQTSEERNAQMGASNARFLSGYGNGFIPDTPGTEELQAARRALERAKKLGEEAKRFDQGDTYFLGNVGRGMKDKFWDDGTWDWGRADLRDAKLAMQLKEKIDRGEELTQEEHTMLGAMAEEAQAEMATHGKQTRGYKAGETTMFMLPFMLEMAANPTVAGTKAAAKKLAIEATDRIARYAWYKAASRLGQGLAHYLTKGGVHLATAIPGGVAQAATTGIQRVEADYIRRRLGEVVPTVNANGEVEFQGFDDSQVDSEAWAAYKALMQQGIENATEIMGAAMPVGKALSIAGRTATASAYKLGYRNTARILAGLGENVAPLYNYMKNWPVANILEKGNWNGNIEEWMEEQIGMALNGILGVEDTFTTDEGGMFNLDNQIDTLLGVGLFGTFVSTAATGSYAYNRHQARKKMAQAERLGTNLFGEHWAENKQRIENANTPEALIGTLRIIAQNCTTAEKVVLFKYADALQRYRAVGLAELAKPQRNPGQPAPLEEKTDDAFSEGAEASTPEEIHAVAQEQKSAEEQLAEADANVLQMIQQRLDSGASNTELQQVMESLEAPVRTLAENYIASRAKSQGVAAGAEQRAEQEGQRYSLAVGINEDESNDGDIPLVTTGYYKEQPYYVRSMGGDMAVLADAKGEIIEVPAEEVTGVTTKPIEELVERHTQEAMDAEQRKAEFYLQHNAKTQMDVQPNMVLQNGNVQLIVTGVEGNEVTVVPATYDAEQGGIVPKSGESAQNISLEEAYQLQDRYYDSIDNDNTLQAQADAQQPSVAGADADIRTDVADTGAGTDGNVGSGTSQAEATGEVAYPTDKQGHTDYTAIEDPEMMASAAQAEFGTSAPEFLDAEIAEAQAVIDNPKTANVERFRARKRISMLNGAKSILAPEAAQTAAEEPRYSVSDDSQQQIPTPEEIEAEAKRRRSEEGHRKIEAMKKDIETLSKALGVKIDYEEGLYEREGCNGKINGTHITLDPAFPEKSLEFLLGHELTHRMQDLSPELYQQFKMTVINVCPDFAQRREKIRSLYERAGFKVGNKIPYNWDGKRQISLEQIDDEAIADYVGERYQMAEGLDEFITAMQQPTILRKLMEFANWVLEKLTSLDNRPILHMQTTLNRAFFNAAAANAAEAQAKAENKPTQQAEPQQTETEEAKEEEQKPAQENKNKRKDNAKKRKKRKAKRYSLATGETSEVELTDDEEEIADTTEQNVLGGVQEDGHLEPVRYSLQGTMAGAGFKSTIVDDDGNQIAMTDEKGNLYVEMDGKRFDHEHHITVDDVKNKETALNYMINDAIALGSLTKERAEEIYKKYVSMLNAYLDKGVTTTDKDGNVISGFQRVSNDWQFIGETVFKTVASNSDDQYAKSIDITKVCKKNEAVINSISNLQRKLGYGITPAQIMDLYLKTIRHGYQVPCPVCYVFSRYINNGKYSTAAINGMKKYGKYLPGQPKAWTVEQWEKELERLEAIKKDKDIENALKKANDDVTKILSEIDKIGEDIMRGRLKGKDRSDAKKRIKMLDKRYRDALNLISQQSLTNWINSFAIHSENGKNVLYTDSPMPKDMKDFETNALDLRLTANTMQKYPAIQRLRKSGGSAAGKEITFAGNNDLGSIIAGLGTGNPEDAENLYLMAAQETDPKKKEALRKRATEQMRKAIVFAKQQSLRGGQRMWSWSDNIERLAPDVAINLMQLDMLGCTLQSYSKQLEGINLVARMNGYVNGSLMAYGIGYEELTDADVKEVDGKKVLAHDIIKTSEQTGKEMKVAEAGQFVYEEDGKMYTLTFDDVVGIQAFDKADPDDGGKVKKGLFALNKTLDKAGNILVGMNDIHVKAAMADDRILFIIPWHSSGQSTHILRQMLSYLGVNLENFNPTDYTDMQEEKDYSKEGAIPDKLTKFWKNHNYEGRKEDGLFPSGFTVESGEGQLSPSQIKYRKMRDAILYGIEDKQPTGEFDKDGKPKYKVVATYSLDNVPKGFDGGIYDNWREEVMADEFLKQVYNTVKDRVQGEWLGKESGNENGLMTSGDRKFIYPYEYWDVTKEQKDADVNGKRYLEYCRRLGFKPKFTGNWKTKNTEEAEKGNFADSPGYWKLLIDRRMYDTNGKYQGLDAVDSAGFEPSLVDPQETGKEFIVTKVADDAGVEEITDDVIETETKRTGKIATVNYDTDIAKAAAKYNETYQKSVEEEKRLEAEKKAKEKEEKEKAKEKEKEAKKKATTKFSLASDLTPNQRKAIQMVNPMAEVESDNRYSIGSGLTKEQIEERIGESLDSKNYNQIRKINPFLGMLYSDKVPETLPYRDVFKTPTLDDYYISTRTTFASVGKRPEGNDRESLKSAEEENRRQWSEMKDSGKYEWHKSPLSSSEYLIDRKSGDIYRFADHWDIVSSCWWKIDEPQGGDKGIMQIGKSNIKDFKGINPYRTQRVENPAYNQRYDDSLKKTISNYETLLKSDVKIQPDVRKHIEEVLDGYKELLDRYQNENYKADRTDRVRYSISEKTDREYLDAVESGDMEKAQQMVMEAAKAAMPDTKVVDEDGNPKMVFHGTRNGGFTVFDLWPQESKGIFTTDSEVAAKDYSKTMNRIVLPNFKEGDLDGAVKWLNEQYKKDGLDTVKWSWEKGKDEDGDDVWRLVETDNALSDEHVVKHDYYSPEELTDDVPSQLGGINEAIYPLYLNIKNPLIIDAKGASWKEIEYDGMKWVADALVAKIKRETDHDGLIINNLYDSWTQKDNDGLMNDIIAFYPEQAKIADPVTYDNSGNVIPLSERFNESNEDIRYSLGGLVGAEGNEELMDNQRIAMEMEEAGKDAREIWFATGWERGKDGKWRFEIPEGKKKDFTRDTLHTVGDMIDAPELFKYYPEIKDYKIKLLPMGNVDGSAYIAAKTIKLNSMTAIGWNSDGHADWINYSTLIHEIQHIIQHIEGFARGGNMNWAKIDKSGEISDENKKAAAFAYTFINNSGKKLINAGRTYLISLLKNQLRGMDKSSEDYEPYTLAVDAMESVSDRDFPSFVMKSRRMYKSLSDKEAFDRYRRLAGETEARNVSARATGMTENERHSFAPSTTEDVPRDEQIVRYSLGGRKPFGGNSGYVGYSMSKRASRARSEGRFPKTDFKKEYGVTDNSLNALVEAGLIRNREWHHTSMYGNRTTFYEWEEPWMADAYTANRKEIERLAKDKPDGYSDAIYDLIRNSDEWKQAEDERKAENARREEETRLRNEYNRQYGGLIDTRYELSNGVQVVTNGSRSHGDWTMYKDGEVLNKNNDPDKSIRSAAVAELDKIIERPSFEQWKEERNGTRYSLSTQLDEQYPGWNDGSTKENGGDNTQVTNTKSTYVGIGKWMLDTGQKNKSVLDASSGLGLGTQALREMGIKADDVEPYATSDRLKDNPPTYTSYADIDKQYDVIISNAVLNVIPDDWREGVVKDMAEHTKPGGKMIVAVRPESDAKTTKNKIELEDENELLVLWPNGNYRHYQKFWTQKELEEDMRQMLGEGWKVERATPRNSGLSGKRAVVCTRTEDGGNGARPELTRNQRMAIAMVTGEPLSEEDTRYSIASKDVADASRFFATDYDVVGEKFKNRNGTVIKRGGSYKGEEFPVGKVLSSNDVYVHKDYANDHMKELEEKGKKYLPEGFKYNCLMYNPKSPDIIRFDEAPGFDKEREPFVGRYIKVDTKEGKVIDEGNSKAIWHGKWQWVGNDYKGFDVREAYEWQRRWASTLNEIAKGGSLPAWNKQLEKFGLPVDEAVNGAQNTRYSIASDGTLVGVHNISEAKLNKAINMGGLVNPSLAVVDTDNGQHTGYGEISLIAPSELVDRKTGRNIGTFDRDAYTPTFPVIEYFSTKESDANEDKLVEGLEEGLGEYIKRNFRAFAKGNAYDSNLEYIFLKEKHPELLPQMQTIKAGTKTTMEEISARFFDGKEPTYEAYVAMPKEMKTEFNLFERGKGEIDENVRKNAIANLDSETKWKKAMAERLLNGTMDERIFDSFIWNVKNDAERAGKPDYRATVQQASDAVRDNGLSSEFEEYKMMTVDNMGYDQQFQVGWKKDGTRNYKKNTLANVSSYMRKQGQNAAKEFTTSSPGALMARVARRMDSLGEIRENRGRLISGENTKRTQFEQDVWDASRIFVPKGSSFSVSDDNFAFDLLADVIDGKDLDKVVKEYNSYHKNDPISLTKEQRELLSGLRERAMDIPAHYFETKFERPVTLDEFAAAVVPNTITPRVEKGLRDAGLPVYKYDPETSGSREEVMQKAISQEPNTRFSIAAATAPTFYSNAGHAVEQISQNKATPEQWEAMLRKNGGLKAEEDKWLGLTDWLHEQTGTVTKQQILDYINTNDIEVQDVEYGDNPLFTPNSKINLESDLARRGEKSVEDVLRSWDSEFGTRMLSAYKMGRFTIDENGKVVTDSPVVPPIDETRSRLTTRGLRHNKEIALVVPSVEPYTTGNLPKIHFVDEYTGGKTVAWIRFGDTYDEDGNRVLVIDEVQSQRHQDARERGYKSEDNPRVALIKAQEAMDKYRAKMIEKYGQYFFSDDLTAEEQKEYERLYKALNDATYAKGVNLFYDVPDAPFRSNWQELAMKRMLRYAAENGYDKLAWTYGRQQAERYGLIKVVNSIVAGRKGDKFHVSVFDKSDMPINSATKDYTKDELVKTFGKDITERMIRGIEEEEAKDERLKNPTYYMTGVDLEVGGKGMEGFYDKMLPNFIDKYCKRLGTKTQDIVLPRVEEAGRVMHSIDITPEMKDYVLTQGQPRYSIASGDVPAETIEAWDRLARSQRFQLRETMFDYLTAIDKFQEFIAKENNGRVMDYQNAYMAMLALSSRNKAEMDVVDNMLVAPLNQIIKKITGAKSRMFGKWDWESGELRRLDMYLKAKHGLERNRDMAVREALAERLEMELSTARNTYTDAKELRAEIEEINKRYRERLDEWYEYLEDERKSGKEWFVMQKDMDEYAEKNFGADLSKDYSGLSGTDKQNPGLFSDAGKDWMEEAYRYVLDYETSRQQADIDELWHRIGAISQYSLNKQNQSGLTSAEYVTEQTRRYQFYVPLRGWNADIAQDEYDYIDSRVGDFGNPIKKARGRQSEAGNVMGALLNIAYRSISTGNKNLAMQKFYNLVSQFNTNGLAVINSRWMELVDGEWTEVAPQIPQDATPEEVAGILARFESEMEDKRKNGEAKRIRGKEKMAYKTIGRQKDEHQVRVYIGGEERVITITGNPRIAQALNGLTNPSVAESDDWMEEKNSAIRNFMAGAFTSKNMAFSLRNLSRDTIHANNYAFCMENFEYWWRFTRNQNLMVGNAANMVKMMRLISGYNKAKNPETEDERLFKEFMENGGATGYTYIQQQDELAKELADMLQKHDKSWANPADYARRFFELTEFFGNAAELSNRFAAYKTSRQMGRSVSRAVSDAKEITLNFNRKGAGKQTKGETSLVRKVASMTNFGRRFILFFNANMQGKYQLLRMLEKHPVKTVASRLVAPAVFMGAMMPIINNVILPAVYQLVGAGDGDDGDDDNYFDSLTDHERSSYLCFRLPNKAGWLKIPLPPDITPMTEMGDLIGAAANGSRDLSGMDVTKCTVDMMSPVNINWGSGDNVNWTAFGLSFAPTAVQPIGQAMTNTNYLGRNIYRKSFTSYDTDPEYRKTYRSTSPLLKELSRVANNLGGGTDYTTSDNIMDVNPALVQHFITSYLGGYGTTAVDITNALYSAYTGEDTSMTIQKVPVVSSFVVFGNKDVTKSRIESAYGEVSAIVNKMKDKESNMRAGYKEAEEMGDVERAAKTMTEFNRMREGYDYKFYSLNKEVVKFIKKLDKSPETSVLQENLKYQLMKELTQMYRYRKPGRLNAYDTEDGMQITIDTEDKDGNVKSTPVTKVR